ncbi:MAG: hypothetical protein ABI912_12295 [Actinomycetota bacterium]
MRSNLVATFALVSAVGCTSASPGVARPTSSYSAAIGVTVSGNANDESDWPSLPEAVLQAARESHPDAATLTADLIELRGIGTRVRVRAVDGSLCLMYGYSYLAGRGYIVNRSNESNCPAALQR